MIAVAKTADLILMMLDATKGETQVVNFGVGVILLNCCRKAYLKKNWKQSESGSTKTHRTSILNGSRVAA